MLYAEAVQLGVTTITISQRNTLPEFHTQQLILGEDVRNGWSLKDVSPFVAHACGGCIALNSASQSAAQTLVFFPVWQIEAGQKNVVASAV